MKLSIKQWTFTLVIGFFVERRAPAPPIASPAESRVASRIPRELFRPMSPDALLLN
jgi:hypothetical protein